jgi:hypothetical protein
MHVTTAPVRPTRPLLAAALALIAISTGAQADPTKTVAVDCGAGDTIGKALTLGDPRKPMIIQVSGTCSESVLIDRDDVTLAAAAAGAAVSGPDPATDVIRVTARRVTVVGLTLTAGRNGITADSAAGITVQNAVVQNTGRNGISLIRGSSGIIDGTTVAGSVLNGIAVDASSVTITNSQVAQNARVGINLGDNSSARIGLDNANNPGGNTISANGGQGIAVGYGSSAIIAMNQITGNGTGGPSAGVGIVSASVDIVGGNTISGSSAQGIAVRAGSVTIGDTGFGVTTVNTVTGNGSAAAPSGVFGFLGSSLNIRDAVISGNTGGGMILSFRSQAQMMSSTIQNNSGDGVRLVFGSSLFPITTNSTVTGNTGFGVNCGDGESSIINTGLLPGIPSNGLGGVAATCTGF